MALVTPSRLAESDLKSIARYTEKRWGSRQAEVYISALRRTINEVAEGRANLVKIVVGTREFERVLSGKHHIYIQRLPHHMFVSRILHGAMDVQLQVLPRMPKKLK